MKTQVIINGKSVDAVLNDEQVKAALETKPKHTGLEHPGYDGIIYNIIGDNKMKKYTEEDFKKFEVDEYGYTICPSGDYTDIKQFPGRCSFGGDCRFGGDCSFGEGCRFGERCSFGEWCSFGKCCSFGKWCSFGGCCRFGEYCSFGEHCKIENNKELEEMIKFEGFGSEHRCTYFFKLTDGKIYVRCGCFVGYIDEFRKKVKKTHGDNKFAKEYMAVADLAEMHFQADKEE